jgi:hypothetical protein
MCSGVTGAQENNMAKNHKNLKYILTTIRDNPGIKASNVQRLLMCS